MKLDNIVYREGIDKSPKQVKATRAMLKEVTDELAFMTIQEAVNFLSVKMHSLQIQHDFEWNVTSELRQGINALTVRVAHQPLGEHTTFLVEIKPADHI